MLWVTIQCEPQTSWLFHNRNPRFFLNVSPDIAPRFSKKFPTIPKYLPWTVVHQAPLSMGFSRQEHWSRLPFSSPGDLLKPGIKPGSLVWATREDPRILEWGIHSLLQGICLILAWNPGLPHCKQILYHLIYQGSPSFLDPHKSPWTTLSRNSVNLSLHPHPRPISPTLPDVVWFFLFSLPMRSSWNDPPTTYLFSLHSQPTVPSPQAPAITGHFAFMVPTFALTSKTTQAVWSQSLEASLWGFSIS